MTDQEFSTAIDMLVNGDKEGLRLIYDAYLKLIYAVVYNTVGNHHDAEDVTSEFFIKMVKVAPVYKKGSPHKTWLTTIAKNLAIDFLRKNRREVLTFEKEESEQNDSLDMAKVNARSNPVETEVMLQQDILNAMKNLNPKEKEVIDLKLIGNFKFREIAEMTGQPMGTVTWLYNQGVTKLRRCLEGYER